MSEILARMHARVARIRARRALVAWELRQESHAKGAFLRLATALSRAEFGLVIDEATSLALVREGWPRDVGGIELHPSKTVLWVDRARARQLVGAPLTLRMDATVLEARHIALVPFEFWADALGIDSRGDASPS